MGTLPAPTICVGMQVRLTGNIPAQIRVSRCGLAPAFNSCTGHPHALSAGTAPRPRPGDQSPGPLLGRCLPQTPASTRGDNVTAGRAWGDARAPWGRARLAPASADVGMHLLCHPSFSRSHVPGWERCRSAARGPAGRDGAAGGGRGQGRQLGAGRSDGSLGRDIACPNQRITMRKSVVPYAHGASP